MKPIVVRNVPARPVVYNVTSDSYSILLSIIDGRRVMYKSGQTVHAISWQPLITDLIVRPNRFGGDSNAQR